MASLGFLTLLKIPKLSVGQWWLFYGIQRLKNRSNAITNSFHYSEKS